MDFKKYPSIENHYQNRFIEKFVTAFPELKTVKFVIQEKLHGSNFQVFITRDSITFGKRTSYLSSCDKFYDFQTVMEKYKDVFDTLQSYVVYDNIIGMRLFGELFGRGVQKGVNYGNDKNFRIFDIMINDELQAPKVLTELIDEKLFDVLIPVVGYANGIDEALNFNTEFNSTLSPEFEKDENVCEGVVIKPYDKVYTLGDNLLYIKKKNEKFKEIQQSKRKPVEMDSDTSNAQLRFLEYLNRNRMDSYYSKVGKIESNKQIGDYIRGMIEDAKVDFQKDNPDMINILDDKKLKRVYGSGGKVILGLLTQDL